jgi:D-serine deaminase-like pyridoxal phosphate-dependent protein
VSFAFRSGPDAGSAPGTCVLDGDVEFPQLVLKQAEFEHNLAAMREFCQARGVSIAPHAKTTMAPAVIRRQLDAGAWGVTAASVGQLRVCLEAGAPVVLLANELVNPAAARWLGTALAGRPGQAAYCIADSAVGVSLLADGWRASGNPARLPVLVELGIPGGRTGCRTLEQAEAVARVIAGRPELRLAGVEAFEGILPGGRSADGLRRADEFLERVAELAVRLDQRGLLAEEPEPVLTAGGSEYFDRVAAVLSAVTLSRPHRVVLRSGCYAFHDHAEHAGGAPLAGADGRTELRPALEAWCEVVSVPEPGLALAALGKRDAPYDAGFPVPFARRPAGGGPAEPCAGVKITAMNDQHAYLRVAPGTELAVGDLLGCGIIHPCTAFDKWRRIALVDDGYRVLDTIDTYF